MRVLLDTHIWLWAVAEPEQIGPALLETLAHAESRLYLSPISVWETLLLAERGRIEVPNDTASWVKSAIERSGVLEAQLTFEIAQASRTLPLDHEDPADRFLAATAVVRGLHLATADTRLLSCEAVPTLPNR